MTKVLKKTGITCRDYQFIHDGEYGPIELQAARKLGVEIEGYETKAQAVYDARQWSVEAFTTKEGATLVVASTNDAFDAALVRDLDFDFDPCDERATFRSIASNAGVEIPD